MKEAVAGYLGIRRRRNRRSKSVSAGGPRISRQPNSRFFQKGKCKGVMKE